MTPLEKMKARPPGTAQGFLTENLGNESYLFSKQTNHPKEINDIYLSV